MIDQIFEHLETVLGSHAEDFIRGMGLFVVISTNQGLLFTGAFTKAGAG